MRLVRSAAGDVEVDGSGRMPGRGAYLCSEAQCWQNGLSGNSLEHVLRVKISNENRERLIEYGKTLSEGVKWLRMMIAHRQRLKTKTPPPR